MFAALLPDDAFCDESVVDWAIGRNKPYRKSVLFVNIVRCAAAAVAIDVCTGIRRRYVHAGRDDGCLPSTKNRRRIRIYDFPIHRLLGAGRTSVAGVTDAEYAMGKGDAATA